MKNHVVIYISLQASYLETFSFSSYGSKYSQPITLQDSLKYNMSKYNSLKYIVPEDKHQSFLQTDTIVFGGHSRTCPKYQKKTSLQYLCNISRNKGGMKLIFCMQVNSKFSCKVIRSFLVGMVCHTQSTQNIKFAKSLQCLKKEVSVKVDLLRR